MNKKPEYTYREILDQITIIQDQVEDLSLMSAYSGDFGIDEIRFLKSVLEVLEIKANKLVSAESEQEGDNLSNASDLYKESVENKL